MGLPPSSVGAFHFNVTELLSNLAISKSRGSPGASKRKNNEVACQNFIYYNITVKKNLHHVIINYRLLISKKIKTSLNQ